MCSVNDKRHLIKDRGDMIMKRIKHKLGKLMSRPCRRGGFTLLESMVTIAIFTVVVGGIYTTMIAGDRSWSVNSIQVEVQQELRKAMGGMQYDLMQSGPSAIDDLQSDSITFYKSNGASGGKISWSDDTTQFLLSGTQLQSIEGSETKVIAQDISSIAFSQPSSNIIEISLTVQKCCTKGNETISDSLNFKVYLRN